MTAYILVLATLALVGTAIVVIGLEGWWPDIRIPADELDVVLDVVVDVVLDLFGDDDS